MGALFVAFAIVENGDVCNWVTWETNVRIAWVACETWVLAFKLNLHTALDSVDDIAALSQSFEGPAVSNYGDLDVDEHIGDGKFHWLAGGLCGCHDVIDNDLVLTGKIACADQRKVDDARQRLGGKFARINLVWVVGDL